MRQIRTSGLMSGEGKRSHWPCLTATAPFLDSTINLRAKPYSRASRDETGAGDGGSSAKR
jgi:hypothetical protein